MLSESQHNALYKYLLIATGITLPIHIHLNVACLVMLTLNWLIEGQFKSKFSQLKKEPLGLLSILFFFWFVVELAFASNTEVGRFAIEKKGAFIIVPLLLFTKKETFIPWIPPTMRAFTYSIASVLALCLMGAAYSYLNDHQTTHFTYHALASYVHQSAIYLSLLCMLAATYVLYTIKKSYTKHTKWYVLFGFFTVCILLLSSKLHLVLFAVTCLALLMPNFKTNRTLFISVLGIVALLTAGLVLTNNPIKQRYNDIRLERLQTLQQATYSDSDYFDGLTLRLLFIRFGYEVLNEHKAWVMGVSPGDNQQYLNDKIKAYHLYTGDPNKGTTGYLNYEYHNQYMETLVGCGLIGLSILLSILIYTFTKAIQQHNILLVAYLFIFCICFLTEAVLEMEIGVVGFTFFNYLLSLPKPIVTPVFEEPLLYV